MCGISGFLRLKGAPIENRESGYRILQDMNQRLRHRGPNDSGLWLGDSVGFAHRRLSIIDLSENGRNPIFSEDRSKVLVANGEIYNSLELRKELVGKGHHFSSQTDTEVILHSYEEKREGCVSSFNGMFAFALWDSERNELLLARDRFGVKPIYYTVFDDTLYFASEAKAFLAIPGFSFALEPTAVAESLTFQNTFGNRTLFKGVHLLPAGNYLCVSSRHDVIPEPTEYWDLDLSRSHQPKIDANELVPLIREKIQLAVERQLISDRPVGAYLSGGLDSGIISWFASSWFAKHGRKPLHTFTCGFRLPPDVSGEEQFFDERREARLLARQLETDHHEIEITDESLSEVLRKVVWSLEEPRAGISYQNYVTAAEVSRYAPVVLSGTGGDELFAGYPWRYRSVAHLQNPENPDLFEQVHYPTTVRLLNDEAKRRLLTPEWQRATTSFSSRDIYGDVNRKSRSWEPVNRALYFDFKTFLHGLLFVEDKLSMAHGIEARVPFLDNDLVDFLSTCPVSSKFGPSVHGQPMQDTEGKPLLRAAMSGLLPPSLVSARKQGFTPPDKTWYKNGLLPFIQRTLLSSRALDRGVFEPDELKKLLADHQAGRANHRFLIWSLLCLEIWHQLFVDREEA